MSFIREHKWSKAGKKTRAWIFNIIYYTPVFISELHFLPEKMEIKTSANLLDFFFFLAITRHNLCHTGPGTQ